MKRSNRARACIISAAVSALGITSAARATPIAYEGFTGDAVGSTISSDSASEGTGFTGQWGSTDPGADTVVANNLATGTSPAVKMVSGVADGRTLASAPASTPGSTVFFSFLMQRQDTGQAYTWASLQNTYTTASINTGDVIDVGLAKVSGTQNPNSDWGISLNAGASATITTGSATGIHLTTYVAQTDVTAQLVVELVYNGSGGDTINMWVNPGQTASPPTPALTVTGDGGSNQINLPAINDVRLYAGSGTTTEFDELTLGTTWSDVVAPEPASLALFALPTLGLLVRRRRLDLHRRTRTL